jgi:hypothetical protein
MDITTTTTYQKSPRVLWGHAEGKIGQICDEVVIDISKRMKSGIQEIDLTEFSRLRVEDEIDIREEHYHRIGRVRWKPKKLLI